MIDFHRNTMKRPIKTLTHVLFFHFEPIANGYWYVAVSMRILSNKNQIWYMQRYRECNCLPSTLY